MKREYVLPDLLASMTADALFAGPSSKNVPKSIGRKPGSLFERWFKAPRKDAGRASTAANLAPDNGPADGRFPRRRPLEVAMLARLPEAKPAGANSLAGSAEVDGSTPTIDEATQTKDCT